jgi:hypothetical protein
MAGRCGICNERRFAMGKLPPGWVEDPLMPDPEGLDAPVRFTRQPETIIEASVAAKDYEALSLGGFFNSDPTFRTDPDHRERWIAARVDRDLDK